MPLKKKKEITMWQKKIRNKKVFSTHAYGELLKQLGHESLLPAWKGKNGKSQELKLPPHQ